MCSQGREKRRDESFQDKTGGRAPGHGTNFHQTISKRSSECWLLIGHKIPCIIVSSPSLCVQGKLSFSTFLTIKEGITDDSSKRFGCYQQDHSNLLQESSVSERSQGIVKGIYEGVIDASLIGVVSSSLNFWESVFKVIP